MESAQISKALKALGYDSHMIRLYMGQEEAASLEDLCWLFSVSDQNRQNDLLPQIQAHATLDDYVRVINRCPEGSSAMTWALEALGAAELPFDECRIIAEETGSRACMELLTNRMAAIAGRHDEWHSVWHFAKKHELSEIQHKAIAGMAATAEEQNDVLCTWDHADEGSPERLEMEAKLDGLGMDCDDWLGLGASLIISDHRSGSGRILGMLMPEILAVAAPGKLAPAQRQLGKMAVGRAALIIENFFQAMATAGMAKSFDEDGAIEQALDRAAELADGPEEFVEVIRVSKVGSPRHIAMMEKLAVCEAPLDVWATLYCSDSGYAGNPHKLLIMRKALGEPVAVSAQDTASA